MTIVKAPSLKLAIDKINKAIFIDKGIIVSNYIFIESMHGDFRIHITNIDNHFEVYMKSEGANFQALVSADLFIKYINKLNDTKDVCFETTAEGLYVEQGRSNAVFAFGDVAAEDFALFEKLNLQGEASRIEYANLKKVLDYLPSAVDENFYHPEFTCFIITKENALTTNSFKICSVGVGLFGTDTSYLLTHKLVKYMQGIPNSENIFFGVDEQGIHIFNENVHVLGLPYESDEAERIVSSCNVLLSNLFDNKVIVNKADLNEALDRLALFVNLETKTAIKFEIKDGMLTLSNLKNTGKESVLVEKEGSVELAEAVWHVDMIYFRALFGVLQGDKIILSYSKDGATIGLSDGQCQQLLALMVVEE